MGSDLDDKVDIELLKKDVSILTALCTKFDESIDRMQEIASNLSKMVSLQEQRLQSQEEITKEIQNRLEMRRIEHNAEIKELHSRITTVNRELTDKIEESEKKILDELKNVKDEICKSHPKEESKDTGVSARLAKIEAWQYMTMGGIAVLTWVLAKADMGAIFKAFFR